MRFNFTATEKSISMYFAGRMYSIPKSESSFDALFDHLKLSEHDYDVVESLINKPKRLSRLTEGAVTVVGSTVYYRSNPVHNTLTEKLLTLMDMGFDVKPWARFMDNVMKNPSEESRTSLYDFLEHWQAPITEDGCFLTFKRVRKDYKDIHSGLFDNSPGKRVEIAREAVDPNRHNECSYGLHVAATSYLNSYASAYNNATIVCKVNPADVIAVPADYQFAKMRVCAYEVLGDAEETDYTDFENLGIVTKYDAYADEDTDGDDMDWFESDLGHEEDEDEDEYSFDDVPEDDGDSLDLSVVADTAVAEAEEKAEKSQKQEVLFTHGNNAMTKKELREGIKAYGQRGFARLTGIPRTTLQDWLAKIRHEQNQS
jgi:hypothetical protein